MKPRGIFSLVQTLLKEALGKSGNGLPLRITFKDAIRWCHENRFWGRVPDPEFLELPWLNYDLLRWITKLRPTSVLEWGSGSSTLWFAQLPARVVSIEHDPAWRIRVLEQAVCRGLDPLIKLEVSREKYLVAGRPEFGASRPDLILIDGNWRPECFIESWKWIQCGSKVVFHDAQSEEYRGVLNSIPSQFKKWESYGPCHGIKNFRGWALIETI